jgi:hypothetical protein
MRPASPKSTVSGHREIIIIIVRETIAIRGERDIPRDAVSGGTPSNKAMVKICMQETAPARTRLKKRRKEEENRKNRRKNQQNQVQSFIQRVNGRSNASNILSNRGGGGKRSNQEQIIPHPHAGQRTRKRCKLQNRSASAESLGCPKIKQKNKRLNLASKKKEVDQISDTNGFFWSFLGVVVISSSLIEIVSR